MRGPKALAGVAIEILVKEQVVAEMHIALKLRAPAEYRPLAIVLPGEEPGDSLGDLVGDARDGHVVSRSGRAFDLEVVAVIAVKAVERGDDEVVERQPDRTAPVRVAAELARRRLRGAVGDDAAMAVQREFVRLGCVPLGEGADAVGRKELGFVEQAAQQELHAMAA